MLACVSAKLIISARQPLGSCSARRGTATARHRRTLAKSAPAAPPPTRVPVIAQHWRPKSNIHEPDWQIINRMSICAPVRPRQSAFYSVYAFFVVQMEHQLLIATISVIYFRCASDKRGHRVGHDQAAATTRLHWRHLKRTVNTKTAPMRGRPGKYLYSLSSLSVGVEE